MYRAKSGDRFFTQVIVTWNTARESIKANTIWTDRKEMWCTWALSINILIAQAVKPEFKFRLSFFPLFSHKSPSGLYTTCVTNACIRHMEITEVVVEQSYLDQMPWFLGRWNHTKTNTPFAVDQHLRLLNVFGKGWSTTLTRDQQFTSKRFEWIYQESCYAVLCQGASYQPGLLFTLIKVSSEASSYF